ncbi:hypothetical protein PHLCEN_2v6315 [Hermanssonia centrifuga]|uniref:Uncharacterized protein n=1 Tax=Hermanssonia centrifuga TaxID=98765 RepID=A0A2R6NZR6_9APHY|nr:hypothetical protein PHLCEN_2v6315 [Hermanssonia centrifuga]
MTIANINLEKADTVEDVEEDYIVALSSASRKSTGSSRCIKYSSMYGVEPSFLDDEEA